MGIQEDLKEIVEYNGAYTKRRSVSADILTEFRGKLPVFMIELWKQYGFGAWSNGLFQICNPHDFDGLLSQIFHADQDFSHKDCHVFACTAFGVLHIWSERHGLVTVDCLNAIVDCPNLTRTDGKRFEDDIVISGDIMVRKESMDVYDDADKPLFARARKRLGDLEPGECYGFFPALAMGGAPKLENLKRTPALPHFVFLAQLQQFTLMDYLSRPIRAVRQIG
jgi:hypothetical protein